MPNNIHPTAVIGEGVELGDNNTIGPYSVIVGPCRIGDGNWIGPHVVIGTPAEYRGGPHPTAWDAAPDGAGVTIGDGNTFREFVTVHQGYREATRLGDRCYLLARSHVGHDCLVDDEVTLAGAVVLGGHAHVWAWANLGLGTLVHQFCQIGPGAMVGMGSVVRRTIEPFTITVGNPARTTGVNRVGLSRRGADEDAVLGYEDHLKGRGELPDGLPVEIREQLLSWAKVTSAARE